MLSLLLLTIIVFFTIYGIIEWKISVMLFISLFPYLSFSIFFAGEKSQKKKEAIDIIRKYPTK